MPAEYPSLEPKLLALNENGYGTFASVNPRRYEGSKESAIATVVAFHTDIDPEKWENSCFAAKTPQGEESASIPIPSLVINSGHGWHLYWRLAAPIPITLANRSHLKAINRGLARTVGGDPACCDLARILRLPGFINHKPPARLVETLARYPICYGLEEMAPFASEVSPANEKAMGEIPEMGAELKERFHKVRRADKTKQMTRAWRGEIGDGSSDSRYVLVKILIESGRFSPEEMVAITCGRQWYNKKSKQLKDPVAVREDAMRLVGKLAFMFDPLKQ